MARTEEAPDPSRMLKRDENEGPLVLGISLGRGDQQPPPSSAATAGVQREEGPPMSAAAVKPSVRLSRPIQPTNVFEDEEEGAS